MVSGKLPVIYACAPASSASPRALALQPRELVHDQLNHFRRRFRSRIGFRDEIARQQHGVHVGRCRIGEAALGSQHPIQTVAAFTAENPDGLVELHVVRRLSRHASCPMRTAVCTASGLSTTIMRRVGFGGSAVAAAGPVAAASRRTPSARPPSLRPSSTSPTMARMQLFGAKYLRWNSPEVGARDRAMDSGSPVSGSPYGWKP